MIIVAKPLQAETENELAEDLKVMDKILREAVAGGDASPPEAMGIRMTMMGGSVEPMYIEECGAVFGFRVNITLAAATDAGADEVESPGDVESPWERALGATLRAMFLAPRVGCRWVFGCPTCRERSRENSARRLSTS